MKSSRIALFEGSIIPPAAPDRTLPQSILLIRYGLNRYTKNGEQGEFDFSESDAGEVIRDFTERGRDLVIDFEHQSLSGEKAPAAGWIDRLEKNVDGLLAHVKYWTQEAQDFLLRGEYRYFSPTLYFSRSGKRVTAIHSAALTNHPAMHGIPALVADDLSVSATDEASTAAASAIHTSISTQSQFNCNCQEENNHMNSLLEKLGLDSFRDAEGNLRMDAMQKRIDALTAAENDLHQFLAANDLKDLNDAGEKIQTLRGEDARKAVEQAFSEGKLAEVMRPWAEDFALKSPEAFSLWCKAAPRIIPDNQNTADQTEKQQNILAASDAEEEKILRLLGLSKNLKCSNRKGNN